MKFYHSPTCLIFDMHTFILFLLHRKLIELIDPFLNGLMLAFCGLKWWKKPEYREETTDLGGRTNILTHADVENQTQVAVVTSKGFTTALSRPFKINCCIKPKSHMKSNRFVVRFISYLFPFSLIPQSFFPQDTCLFLCHYCFLLSFRLPVYSYYLPF